MIANIAPADLYLDENLSTLSKYFIFFKIFNTFPRILKIIVIFLKVCKILILAYATKATYIK